MGGWVGEGKTYGPALRVALGIEGVADPPDLTTVGGGLQRIDAERWGQARGMETAGEEAFRVDMDGKHWRGGKRTPPAVCPHPLEQE